MDLFLLILAFVTLVIAMVGSIVPALPGVPLAYLSLWLGRWSEYTPFSNTYMWIMAGVTIVVFLADYFLPPMILKRFGGSKAGKRDAYAHSSLDNGHFCGQFTQPEYWKRHNQDLRLVASS